MKSILFVLACSICNALNAQSCYQGPYDQEYYEKITHSIRNDPPTVVDEAIELFILTLSLESSFDTAFFEPQDSVWIGWFTKFSEYWYEGSYYYRFMTSHSKIISYAEGEREGLKFYRVMHEDGTEYLHVQLSHHGEFASVRLSLTRQGTCVYATDMSRIFSKRMEVLEYFSYQSDFHTRGTRAVHSSIAWDPVIGDWSDTYRQHHITLYCVAGVFLRLIGS
jgi:hypothetical protein